jgi:hypothetical protein
MTEIREAPRELVALALAIRPDWSEDEIWVAVQACKTAGFEWPRVVRNLIDLALKDEPAPTRPGELWDAVRGIKSPAVAGRLDPEARARAIEACEASPWGRATGPQPRLTATGELELLREGADP